MKSRGASYLVKIATRADPATIDRMKLVTSTALALVFALSACSGGSSGTSSPDPEPDVVSLDISRSDRTEDVEPGG